MLFIKTTRGVYPDLEKAICALHPYDTPEIIAMSVAEGLPSYLAWVVKEAK